MLRILLTAIIGLQLAFFAPLRASAQMLSTHEVVRTGEPLSKQLLAALEKEETVKELDRLGLDATEAKHRIAGMSDSEIQQIVNGTQPHAGGDVIVVSLTTILLVVIIILLID